MFDSELPTKINPARAAIAARVAAKALAEEALRERERGTRESGAQEIWCDSEAPTGVAAERPLLPRPPRAPRV